MKNPYRTQNTLYRRDLLSLRRALRERKVFAYRDVFSTKTVMGIMAGTSHYYKELTQSCTSLFGSKATLEALRHSRMSTKYS